MKIAILVDVFGWAWEKRALGIRKYAPAGFEVEIFREADWGASMFARFDRVLAMNWNTLPQGDWSKTYAMLANEGVSREFPPATDADYVGRSASRSKNAAVARAKLPKFRGVITINHRLVDWARDINANTHYLRTGVDHELWVPSPVEFAPNKTLRIGWCGKSFGDQKGMFTPKGEMPVLSPLMSRLAGDVEFRINRRSHADRLNHDEMQDFYTGCDIFLITSSHEGTPSTLLEAMACGRPFLATDVGIVQEVALTSDIRTIQESADQVTWSDVPDGLPVRERFIRSVVTTNTTGIVVESYKNDGEAIAVVDKMEKYIRSMAWVPQSLVKMGERAREVVEKEFSWETLSAKWLETLSQ